MRSIYLHSFSRYILVGEKSGVCEPECVISYLLSILEKSIYEYIETKNL